MPSSSSTSNDDKQKNFLLFAKELLGHLYSGNVLYQDRMVSAYYHPLVVFQDQFVAIKSSESLLRLMHIYFGWFVEHVDVDILHVSAAPEIITVPITHSSNTTPDDSSPLVSPIDSNSTSVMMKRRGITVIIDHNLRVKSLTTLGKVLRFLRLLPPPTILSYAPESVFPNPGLRILTKLTWVTDIHAPMHPTAFQERGYILCHENMYNPSRQSGYLILYPFFWLFIFFSFLALSLQKIANLVTFFLGKAVVFSHTHAYKEPRFDMAVQRLNELWNQNVPDDFENSLKQAFGWLLTDLVAKQLEKPHPPIGQYSPRKRGDVAVAG